MIPSNEPGRWLFPNPSAAPGRGPPWRLAWYILWRAVGALVVFFLVLTLIFYALEVVPGDPSRFLVPRGPLCPIGDPKCPPSVVDQWGLNKPVLDRYVIFLTNILTGNLGVSTSYHVGVPVWNIIVPTLPGTLAFVGVTMLMLALLSLPVGMRLSRKKGGLLDTVASFLLAVPFAMPAAVLGLLAIYLFAFVYKVFPLVLQPSTDPLTSLANQLWYDVLPELVLLGTSIGLFVWVVRDHPLRPEADLQSPPAGDWHPAKKTARSRVAGAIPRFLAAVPILLPWTLAAVLLAEVAFNINGTGLLFWTAIVRLDFFLAAGVIIVLALLVVFPVVFAADILHYWLTSKWDRMDAVRVDDLRINPSDPFRVGWKVLTSFLGLVGLALVIGLTIVSVAAPLLVGPYPTAANLSRPFLPPSSEHLLGTDEMGRDIFTVLVYGGQPAIAVAALAFTFALAVGFVVMLGIGFFGERAAVFLVVPIDLFLILSTPFVLLLILTAGRDIAVWGPALVGGPVAARLLLLETTGMVPGSRRDLGPKISLDERGRRSLTLVWGTAPLIVANAMLAAALSLVAWAILGFMGLGFVGPGTVESWGQMVNGAYNTLALLRGQWWYLVSPTVCILLAVLGPTLLALQLKKIGVQVPRFAVPVEAPPPVVSVVPPGTNP